LPNRTGDTLAWTYDQTCQLRSEHRTGSNAYRHAFTYDAAGNRILLEDGSQSTTYAYDAANRLRYSQDGAGRTTFTFDACGNQLTQETPAGDLTTQTWDGENQMRTVETPDGELTTYTWNASQMRVAKESDSDTTQFLWDGQNIVREYDGLSLTTAEYTLAPQPQPQPYGDLLSQHRDGDSSFYHFDALGSAQALTDGSQVVSDQYAYQAFGKNVASTGTTENAFGWVGEKGYYRDEETGQSSLRRRQYDPVTGRFVSEDPIGLKAADANLYRCVKNSPLSRRDASGLEAEDDLDQLTDEEVLTKLRGAIESALKGFDPAKVPEARLAELADQCGDRCLRIPDKKDGHQYYVVELGGRYLIFRENFRVEVFGGELATAYEFPDGTYSLVKQTVPGQLQSRWHAYQVMVLDQPDVASVVASEAVLNLVVGMTPFLGTADLWVNQGQKGEAVISGIGDAFLIAGPLAKFLKASDSAVKAIRVADVATESAIAVYRANQAYYSVRAGDTAGAIRDSGEVLLRLFGVALSKRELRALRDVSFPSLPTNRTGSLLPKKPAQRRAQIPRPKSTLSDAVDYDVQSVPGPNPNNLQQRAVTTPTTGEGGVYLKPENGRTKVGSTDDFRLRYGAKAKNGIEVEIPQTRKGPAADDSAYQWTERRQRRFDEEYVDRMTPREIRYRDPNNAKPPVSQQKWEQYRHIFGYGDLSSDFGY
jgi:RHS repeat-associated protein